MTHSELTVPLRIAFNGALEHVPARPAPELGAGAFELCACPGLAEGAAAGDVVVADGLGSFTVVRRSGNLTIQAVALPGVDDLVMERAFSRELGRLGGRLDGGFGGIRVYCIPIDAGFSAIESACAEALLACPGAQWMFANVYDVATGALLPWVQQWMANHPPRS